MRIIYFGIYDPNYARNLILINGLKKGGVEVVECRENPRRFSLARLALKYILLKKDFDLAIVGFPGQEVMFLAKLLIRKPIIFDAFTSHYGGYILDRKKWSPNSLRAKYFRFLDKWSCRLADRVLLDTDAHINFFIKEYNLNKNKFVRIWAGANNYLYKPTEIHEGGSVKNILFFGTFIPLQGVEYIMGAAKILAEDNEIFFTIIGEGQERKIAEELARKANLKNIIFKNMMSPEKLCLEISRADICLGIFGDTIKSRIVIPNKVFMSLAMKKPVITSDTPAIRELFDDSEIFMVKGADSVSLAEGIKKLIENDNLRYSLAERGYNKFIRAASIDVLGNDLIITIRGLISNK